MAASQRLLSLQLVSTKSPRLMVDGLRIWQDLGLLASQESRLQICIKRTKEPELKLTLETATNQSQILTGLDAWLDLGLLEQSTITCEIQVNVVHPQLLTGLDYWLNLQLMNPAEMQQLVQTHLTCRILEPINKPSPIIPPMEESASVKPLPSRPTVLASTEAQPTSPVFQEGYEPEAIPPRPSKSREIREPSKVEQVVQSLLAELSVLWLLLLGVFMVVISSVVLAASQWQNFPATIQYGILWLYTIAFWGASFWTTRQSHLRLTGQALCIVTLLLIPVNFVAMDSFQLWDSLVGLGVMAIAALSLSALARNLLLRGRRRRQQRWLMVNHLGLSYLQWGWAIPGVPLAATYAGMVGTTAITLYRFAKEGATETPKRSPLPFSLNGALILYALLILLIRAIFFAWVPIPQLGLAIALGGALMVGQAAQEMRHRKISRLGKSLSLENWQAIGGAWIGLGWLVSVYSLAWQAFLISFLGLWFFTLRLYRRQHSEDLCWLWLTGLQMFWLGWRLVPETWQTIAITWGQQLTGLENQAFPLLSLALFPYLVLTVNITDRFIRRNKIHLATAAAILSGSLGIILTVLSLSNPLLRTLNVGGSSLLLIGLTRTTALQEWPQNQEELSPPQALAFLSHLGLVLTLGTGIDGLFPDLSMGYWALIGLGLTLLETLWSLNPSLKPLIAPVWLPLMGASAKGFALGLGAIAYGLLWFNQTAQWQGFTQWGNHPLVPLPWGLFWGLVPLSWTAITVLIPRQRSEASRLGIGTGILWQGLTLLDALSRWLGLGTATLILLVNTSYAPSQ